MEDQLIPVNKYNKSITTLTVLKRIAVDYPILVRSEVAKKLADVANDLPDGITLQIDSGYRAPEVQKILWEVRYNQFKEENPDLSDSEIEKKTEALVGNPKKKQSSHSTGGAVDISFVKNGKEINLSAPFVKYYTEPQLRSDKISEEAQEKRLLLNKLMLEQGFVANPIEYWHFSYGDRRWAEHNEEAQIYSQMKLNPEYYYPPYRRFYNRIIRKVWKFIIKLFKLQTSY